VTEFYRGDEISFEKRTNFSLVRADHGGFDVIFRGVFRQWFRQTFRRACFNYIRDSGDNHNK